MRIASGPAPNSVEVCLSPRELAILQLIALNKTNRQIARALRIRPSTVTWYNHQLFGQLRMVGRVELAVWFERHREVLERVDADGKQRRGPVIVSHGAGCICAWCEIAA